ncbi:hypothetical protein [Nocardia sp. NPDC059228]|uniref:hypothetical protein n=1 Tax=Nocardia sp. NPDC059228 TaxID=3346777 RepID=UPI0036819CE2
MDAARTDGPGGNTEPGGIVGWSTICGSFHDGKDRIGMLQAVNDRIDDGPPDVDTDCRPVAGFEDKARVGTPFPNWTEVRVYDGTWTLEMSFVKQSPEQELLGTADVYAVAAFLVQVAHDLKG